MADATSSEQLPPADDVAKVVPVEEEIQKKDEEQQQQPPADATTATEEDGDSDNDILSKKVTLADLSAKGTALYAHKNYEEAAEIFSRASILQAEINGETAPENAEILFHYGRTLFRVGQSKSDVLGGSAPVEKKAPKANGKAKPVENPAKGDNEGVAEKTGDSNKDGEGEAKNVNKALFQFTGDENFDESDEDEVGAVNGENDSM
jgi:phosphoribosyl-ATP pyrophosphohydrolase